MERRGIIRLGQRIGWLVGRAALASVALSALLLATPRGAAAQYLQVTQITGIGQNGLVGIATFDTPENPKNHVVAATIWGQIMEFSCDVGGTSCWSPYSTRAYYAGVRPVAIGAFYTPDDGARHAIVALPDGSVREIYWRPWGGGGDVLLARFPQGVVSVAGFYSPNDRKRHVIVALKDGTVRDIDFHPQTGIRVTTLRTYSSPVPVKVAGFYTADDSRLHAIVALSDGSVRELYYRPGSAVGDALLARFWQPVTALHGFSLKDINNREQRRVSVGLADRSLREIVFHPATGIGVYFVRTMSNPIIGLGVVSPLVGAIPGANAIVGTGDGYVYWLGYAIR